MDSLKNKLDEISHTRDFETGAAMKRRELVTRLSVLAGLLLLLAGCNTVSVSSKQYLGMPIYPPTDPASVQIMRSAPVVIVQRLGEVSAEPNGNPSVESIEAKMRDAAAKMGANAVVIVSDNTTRMGAIIVGPWYDRQISSQYQRAIVGVAVRYPPPR
jgi:hypothetical protein